MVAVGVMDCSCGAVAITVSLCYLPNIDTDFRQIRKLVLLKLVPLMESERTLPAPLSPASMPPPVVQDRD